MSKQLIMVTSITSAMKGKQVLKNHGIYSDIERTPKKKSTDSCGYSLSVPNKVSEAEKILKENGIRILGIIEKDGI